MSQDFDDPSPTYESLSWIKVWSSALTKPSVKTYDRLVRDPNASTTRALGWVFISALIGYILNYFLTSVVLGLYDAGSLGGFDIGLSSNSIIGLACLAPIAGVGAVVGLLIYTGIAQLIARVLGGTGTYSDLIYAYGAFMAPLLLLMSILLAIPLINLCLTIPLAVYYFALAAIAINAVNQFGWAKAIASAFLGPVALAGLISCAMVFLLILGGPQIGDVFSRIIEDLSTPGP